MPLETDRDLPVAQRVGHMSEADGQQVLCCVATAGLPAPHLRRSAGRPRGPACGIRVPCVTDRWWARTPCPLSWLHSPCAPRCPNLCTSHASQLERQCGILLQCSPLLGPSVSLPTGCPMQAGGRLETVSSSARWEDLVGYSRAAKRGPFIFVSGTQLSSPAEKRSAS